MLDKLWKYISRKNKVFLSQVQSMMLLSVGLGLYHFCLLMLYVYYEIDILTVVNIFSVLLYIGCAIAIHKRAKILHVLRVCYAEIIMQVLVASAMIGYECGFEFYLLAITCHAFYMAYIYRNDKSVNPLSYVCVDAAAFIIQRWWVSYNAPVYTFRDPEVSHILYILNYFTAVIVIAGSMTALLAQILHLEGRLLQENKDLEVLSQTDALTGLVNRRAVEEKYQYMTQNAEQYAVIMGDIDNFKRINDTYGHNVGDAVLRRVAEIFNDSIRGEDVVCRWGGEEILVVLPLCKMDGAELTAKRIMDRMRRARVKTDAGEVIHFTMTFGIAESTEGEGLKEVVKMADDRLYEGKSRGKNCIISKQKRLA
ncbi:MAG: GGDEF domain-containing protein [Butyrivibrio sp.]|nr:GGDEF domain-containing protein [Muribaculum sp.]MCM1553220.1 GGDEF domain-containing protein [Butyrivibrio sp.]